MHPAHDLQLCFRQEGKTVFCLGKSGKSKRMTPRPMRALRAQGKASRAIAATAQAKGHRISHEGVGGVLIFPATHTWPSPARTLH
jgi:hypothetical protein